MGIGMEACLGSGGRIAGRGDPSPAPYGRNGKAGRPGPQLRHWASDGLAPSQLMCP